MGFEFPELKSGVIIAMKGLPCTAKSVLGMLIGDWARCPVLYVDHFLDALSLERGYTAGSPPSPDEAQRLHRLAFDALCKAASHYLRWGAEIVGRNRRVVVKSRLSSTSEVDRLVQLARECDCGAIFIAELQIENEYRYRVRLEREVELGSQEEWYKLRRWNDIEKAIEEEEEGPIWDRHLWQRLLADDSPRVARVVFNPCEDFYLDPAGLHGSFKWNVSDLLRRFEEDGSSKSNKQDLLSVHYNQYRRSLIENQVRDAPSFCAPTQGRKSQCKSYCHFKYWERLPDDKGKAYDCGVCDTRVVSATDSAYSCIYCFLLLHKSCAEDLPLVTASNGILVFTHYPIPNNNDHVHERRACASCSEGGKGFSPRCGACLFQTHLKCRLLPTVLNHDCHPEHPLTLIFGRGYICAACGAERRFGNALGPFYGCLICFKRYDMECVGLLREAEHQHGGHDKHVLKLIYSHGGGRKQHEESYWCDVCYKDMDPYNWFYKCQQCPYFSAHPPCINGKPTPLPQPLP